MRVKFTYEGVNGDSTKTDLRSQLREDVYFPAKKVKFSKSGNVNCD